MSNGISKTQSVPCPECGAAANEGCRSASGYSIKGSHKARTRARIEMEERQRVDADEPNIILTYRVKILRGDDMWLADGAEFFKDEQGSQWVKFIARNGYQIGKEHMMRTENVVIIRDSH